MGLLLLNLAQNSYFYWPLSLRIRPFVDPLAQNPYLCWSLSLRILTFVDISQEYECRCVLRILTFVDTSRLESLLLLTPLAQNHILQGTLTFKPRSESLLLLTPLAENPSFCRPLSLRIHTFVDPSRSESWLLWTSLRNNYTANHTAGIWVPLCA